MAIGGRRGSVRDIQTLAARVYQRWLAYRRANPGMSIPVDDTLSRLFEHVPEYRPHRERSADRQERAAKSPGIFKLQQVAETLDTTVGDLLGERGYDSPLELLSQAERQTLRDAVQILRNLFDLDDPNLDREGRIPPPGAALSIGPNEFIERDHDYPRPLHAWVVPEVPAMAGNSGVEPELTLSSAQILHSVREVWDARLQVVRVIGDSMAPDLQHGWKVLVDTAQIHPVEGALVAVYIKDEGGVLGRWESQDGKPILRKANREYSAIRLGAPDDWMLWGTVTTVVEAPVELRKQ